MSAIRYIPVISGVFREFYDEDKLLQAFYWLFGLALRHLKQAAVFILQPVWLGLTDLANVGLLVSKMAAVLVLVCFIKSLRTRYNFCRHDAGPESPSPVIYNVNENQITPRSALSMQLKIPSSPEMNDTPRIMGKLSEYGCSAPISSDEAQSVYRYLPWAQTRIDLENVQWINQTVQTFWPSIKTMLNKVLLGGIFKIKKVKIPPESRRLANERTKLTLYLSCRRKLDFLRNTKRKRFETDSRGLSFERGLFRAALILMKLFIVYWKQFVMDFIISIVGNKSSRQPDEASKESASYGSKDDYLDPQRLKAARSWNGLSWMATDPVLRLSQRSGTNKSAPSHFVSVRNSIRKRTVKPAILMQSRRFLKNRLLLAGMFKQAHADSQPEKITIERIRLGGTLPVISGIKLIEKCDGYADKCGPRGGLYGDINYKVLSEDSCIRLLSEITYESDRDFGVKISSIPILGRICLTKVKFHLRFLVTLNHTTTELNRDLKVFQTPDDVRFPVINYVQLTLIDTPRFDWTFEAGAGKSRPGLRYSKRKRLRTSGYWNVIVSALKRRLSIIYIINNSYFKFLVHATINLTLRWFQPFDIKVGEHFYFKTTQ